jgi:hypothetical protein
MAGDAAVSLKSAPYYWVECDAEGCTSRAPDHDVSAWADEDQAIGDASTDGWVMEGCEGFPEGIGHWCFNHSHTWVCPECGEARVSADGPCGDTGCGWTPEAQP